MCVRASMLCALLGCACVSSLPTKKMRHLRAPAAPPLERLRCHRDLFCVEPRVQKAAKRMPTRAAQSPSRRSAKSPAKSPAKTPTAKKSPPKKRSSSRGGTTPAAAPSDHAPVPARARPRSRRQRQTPLAPAGTETRACSRLAALEGSFSAVSTTSSQPALQPFNS